VTCDRIFKESMVNGQRFQQGITYVEIVLVVAIIAILGAMSSPFLSRFLLQNDLDITTERAVSSIRKAQNYAMDGKNDETWGVCISGDNIRLFSGTCSTPTFSEDFSIPSSVTITALSETTFSKLRGEPSATMNVTISTDIDSLVVSVNAAGGMEVN